MRRALDATFAVDLARGAAFAASQVRGGAARFAPANLADGKKDTYWSTDDGVTVAEVVVEFGKSASFDVVRLRECLPLGQRVDAFALDAWKDGAWSEFAKGTSIGNLRLLRTERVTTPKVRLRITKASAPPAISELGFHEEPAGSRGS
jgi:alpha-L-fucosidase